MTEDEIKQAIADAVAEATKALKDKNAELLKEKQQAKADAEAAKEQAEKAAEDAALASTNIDEVRKTLEAKHKRELEKLAGERDEAVSGRNTLLIDNQITADLVAHNVAKPFHSMLAQALKAQATVKDNAAFIGDLPLSEHITKVINSDDGKHFVSAPANSGAGALGASKSVGSNATGITKENFNLSKFMELAKSNPTEANALADSLNMPHLKV